MAMYQVKNHSSVNLMDSAKTTITAASLQQVWVPQLSEQRHFTITKRTNTTTATSIATPMTKNPDMDEDHFQEPHILQQPRMMRHTP
jgi:hypothetical protein